MKKFIFLITGLAFLASISFSQSITITKPVNGDPWEKNIEHIIEWIFSGQLNSSVIKIKLFNANGTTAVKNIADDFPTIDRRFRCPPNFFNDVPNGIYRIRVKVKDYTVLDDSEPFFIGPAPTIERNIEVAGTGIQTHDIQTTSVLQQSIKDRLNPPGIKITYPNKNTNWRLKLGNISLPFPIRIQWKKKGHGSQDNHVKIFLFRKVRDRYMRKKILLTPSTRNIGLFTGRISRDLRSSMYTIIIQTLDGKIRVESEMFQITNAENDPH